MYGKLFESTFTGSMYGKGPIVFSVWSYVIAHTKPDGMVELNPLMLAGIIGCQASEIEAALEYLCSPDNSSRTKEAEGRRLIKEGEYLYKTVNYSTYNSVRNEPQRREYNRIKKQESRARIAAREASQPMSNHPVKPRQARQPTHTHTHTQKEEEESAAAIDHQIEECPRDMDAASEYLAFGRWCQEKGQAPTFTRWRRWVLRAKESGRYAKQKPRPPTEAEIQAERRRIIAQAEQAG